MRFESRHRGGVTSRLGALAVAGMLLLAFGAYEYLQVRNPQTNENRITSSSPSSNQSTVGSLQAQTTSSDSLAQVLSSPCAERPINQSTQAEGFANGTEIVNYVDPVFGLLPGNIGTLCMSYTNISNTSSWSGFNYTAFYWDNFSSIKPTGISFVENPGDLIIPARQTATVVYTVEASNSSAGYFGLSLEHDCGFFQLVVSSNPSAANFSDFPGLLPGSTNRGFDPNRGGCMTWKPPGTLLGFNGFSTVYLRYATSSPIGWNETSRSVASIVESPTEQNITFTMGIQSFSYPITVRFATGTSTFSDIRKFTSNPEVTPIPGNACDWNIVNQSAFNTMNEYGLPIQGITVNAPTLQLQPFSHGTFTFSMLISNLTAGYYVTFLAFVVTWQYSPGINTASDLGTYFPISVGSGQWNENINGTCPASGLHGP